MPQNPSAPSHEQDPRAILKRALALKKADELQTMQETANSKTAASKQPAHDANAARLDALLSAAQNDSRNDPAIPDGIDEPDRQAERALEPAVHSMQTDYFANKSTDATDVKQGRPTNSGTAPRTLIGPKAPRGMQRMHLLPVAAIAIFIAAGTGVYLYGDTDWTIVEGLPGEQSNAMVLRELPDVRRTVEMDPRKLKQFEPTVTVEPNRSTPASPTQKNRTDTVVPTLLTTPTPPAPKPLPISQDMAPTEHPALHASQSAQTSFSALRSANPAAAPRPPATDDSTPPLLRPNNAKPAETTTSDRPTITPKHEGNAPHQGAPYSYRILETTAPPTKPPRDWPIYIDVE